MAHYSNGLPYLEDASIDRIYEAQCENCAIEEEVEGTHYLDSESFIWQCPKCQFRNMIDLPYINEPDPDEAHDRLQEERRGFFA